MLYTTRKTSILLVFNIHNRNYKQALSCYMKAGQYDPTNFNVVRDLSYLQLYLRHFNSFIETARKGVNMRSNMLVNWTTYAFANYLLGYYDRAFTILEQCQTIGLDSIKPQEKNEIIFFQSKMLELQGHFEESLKFLQDNKSSVLDQMLYSEKLINLCSKMSQSAKGIEHVNNAFKINPENANYYISYFKFHLSDNETLRKIQSYQDLMQIHSTELKEKLLLIVQNDLKPRLKSRIITRLELAFSNNESFKALFNTYFLLNVKLNIPSIFINMKFIYNYHKEKIPLIEEQLELHLSSIKSSYKLHPDLTKSAEEYDITPNIIWVYYYAAAHFDFLRNSERALELINLAIDSTPTVVEFFMLKSKILSHSGLIKESALSYEKAKKLDLGDRYLNAKYAKIFLREGDVEQAVKVMCEFVRDPLMDENIDHFQNMWFETEAGFAYLRQKSILRGHRLFKSILQHFHTLIEDQVC
jgi:tetratricopeptide (TPR) repeat protein